MQKHTLVHNRKGFISFFLIITCIIISSCGLINGEGEHRDETVARSYFLTNRIEFDELVNTIINCNPEANVDEQFISINNDSKQENIRCKNGKHIDLYEILQKKDDLKILEIDISYNNLNSMYKISLIYYNFGFGVSGKIESYDYYISPINNVKLINNKDATAVALIADSHNWFWNVETN